MATNTSPTSNNRSLLFAAAVGGVIAAVANAIVYFVGDSAGVEFIVPAGGPGSENTMELPLVAIILISAAPAFIAAGLIATLRRFTDRAMTVFYVIAAVILVISFFPLGQEGVAEDAIIYLAVMHVAAAGAIVGAFAYARR
jgi:hypothetical protein